MNVLDIQRRLAALGFDPGPLDGAYGRRTIAAVKAFQVSRGLVADGLIGPLTVEAFNIAAVQGGPTAPRPAAVVYDAPPWMKEAQRHIGLREVAGAKHNATILKWLEFLKAGWRDDETAWCGTFVGWCLASTMPEEALPTNPFGARNWQSFGVGLDKPALGAVLVFWRGSRSGWQGHVGFAAGQDADAFHVLGGNQSDAVTVTRIAKSRLLAALWPKGFPLPTQPLPVRTLAGSLSKNEA